MRVMAGGAVARPFLAMGFNGGHIAGFVAFGAQDRAGALEQVLDAGLMRLMAIEAFAGFGGRMPRARYRNKTLVAGDA